jgi:rhodanese-related sulfurtransferase
MTTISTGALTTVMARHQPFDLIDVRPRQEFNRSHIPGARSTPLNRFAAAKILHDRKGANAQPFFIIGGDRIRAGLAAGMLCGAGCNLPVVVEGGMTAWEAQGLPVIHGWFSRAKEAR